MEALAKGCHKLLVTRHASNKTIGQKRIRQLLGEQEEDTMSESEASWTENLFGEAPSQVMSLDDEYTPIQEEDDDMQGEGEHSGDVGSSLGEEVIPTELEAADTIRV